MKAITKLNRNIFVSAVMFISALAGISLPYNSVQADGITIDRNLVISTTVEPGSTFVVNIVFNAPADVFNSIVLHDETPQGWLATGDNNMCLPEAQTSKKYGTGGMEYTWLGPTLERSLQPHIKLRCLPVLRKGLILSLTVLSYITWEKTIIRPSLRVIHR